jgi:hypothetical protein
MQVFLDGLQGFAGAEVIIKKPLDGNKLRVMTCDVAF